MAFKLSIKIPSDILPTARELAQAGASGISTKLIEHLRAVNARKAPRSGFKKTDYYADAADSVTTVPNGTRSFVVSIEKEGVALHYEGGTVKPKKKALAVPIDPRVQDIWPSELGEDLVVAWPKGETRGFLVNDKDEFLYMLLPQATIPAEPDIIPTESDLANAASEAIWSLAA